ncbi:type I-E CRISPR-associated endoribonuclease Cas2e [Streptomyces diastaticus]|uniref:type I-E CRISPR-associated endoribonuclease Cas2e n=1 Tax=Streptomyces diastaticus TaxID=1956 RepID=UPI00364D3316
MTVIILIAAPEGLRGHLTRWMVEGNAGVFVGNPSRRIRDRLWELLTNRIGDGQAVLVEPSTNEQRWAVRTAGRDRWRPVDYEGLILSARRPAHTQDRLSRN